KKIPPCHVTGVRRSFRVAFFRFLAFFGLVLGRFWPFLVRFTPFFTCFGPFPTLFSHFSGPPAPPFAPFSCFSLLFPAFSCLFSTPPWFWSSSPLPHLPFFLSPFLPFAVPFLFFFRVCRRSSLFFFLFCLQLGLSCLPAPLLPRRRAPKTEVLSQLKNSFFSLVLSSCVWVFVVRVVCGCV